MLHVFFVELLEMLQNENIIYNPTVNMLMYVFLSGELVCIGI